MTTTDEHAERFTVMLRPLRAVHAFEDQMKVRFAAAMAAAPDSPKHTNLVARAIWASIEARHVPIVRALRRHPALRLAQ